MMVVADGAFLQSYVVDLPVAPGDCYRAGENGQRYIVLGNTGYGDDVFAVTHNQKEAPKPGAGGAAYDITMLTLERDEESQHKYGIQTLKIAHNKEPTLGGAFPEGETWYKFVHCAKVRTVKDDDGGEKHIVEMWALPCDDFLDGSLPPTPTPWVTQAEVDDP